MPRTKFTSLDNNHCEIVIPEGDGKEIRIEYWAPHKGGYVRDVTRQPGTLGKQVCDGLTYMGNTLHWNGQGNLVDLIRYEHRKSQRQERRNESRWGGFKL